MFFEEKSIKNVLTKIRNVESITESASFSLPGNPTSLECMFGLVSPLNKKNVFFVCVLMIFVSDIKE